MKKFYEKHKQKIKVFLVFLSVVFLAIAIYIYLSSNNNNEMSISENISNPSQNIKNIISPSPPVFSEKTNSIASIVNKNMPTFQNILKSF